MTDRQINECVYCDERVDVTRGGWMRAVVGWERVRQGGGGHGLTLRAPTGQVAHVTCVQAAKLRGGDLIGDDQGKLW